MKVTIEWIDEHDLPLIQQEVSIDLSDTITIRPVIPKALLVCGERSIDMDFAPFIKGIRIKVITAEEGKARETLSIIKGYVDKEYFKLRDQSYNTPWYYPINKLAAQKAYMIIHVVRELIKKVEKEE